MTYYKLRCNTCDEDYIPLRATEPGELLYPDYDETCPCCGGERHRSVSLDNLRVFHRKHRNHDLVEVVEEVDD